MTYTAQLPSLDDYRTMRELTFIARVMTVDELKSKVRGAHAGTRRADLVSSSQPARSSYMELQAGTTAPDFTLASHTDQKLSLASFRGRLTVVSFLPFAFTGG
jgi:hypothetical protein